MILFFFNNLKIWHSIIKEASEIELCRIGIPIGGSQLSVHKNNTIYRQNNTLIMHSNHKHKPYSTEVSFSTPRTPITPVSFRNSSKQSTLKKRIGTTRRIFQNDDSVTQTTKITENSRQKLQRLGTLDIGDSEDEEFCLQTATPSVKKFRKMTVNEEMNGVNIRICFWARPRHYPVNYILRY